MQKIHDFVNLLAQNPNPNLLNHKLGKLINKQEDLLKIHKKQTIRNSYINLNPESCSKIYIENLKHNIPCFLKQCFTNEQIHESLNNSSNVIQKAWRNYKTKEMPLQSSRF